MKSIKTMFLGIILMLLGVGLTSNLATVLFVENLGYDTYPTYLVILAILFIFGGLVIGLIGFFQKVVR